MKLFYRLSSIFYLLGGIASAGTFHCEWKFRDGASNVIAIKQVTVQTIAPYGVDAASLSLITSDRRTYQSDATGSLIVSNLFNGRAYRVELSGPYIKTTITNSFDTNVTGLVNGADPLYLAAPIRDASVVAYSQTAADARFLRGIIKTGASTNNGVVTLPDDAGNPAAVTNNDTRALTFEGQVDFPAGIVGNLTGNADTATTATTAGTAASANSANTALQADTALAVSAGVSNQWTQDIITYRDALSNRVWVARKFGTNMDGTIPRQNLTDTGGGYTNSKAALANGGLALSSRIFGTANSFPYNHHNGLKWMPYNWDGAPYDPNSLTIEQAGIDCYPNWGFSTVTDDSNTMHIWSKQNIRIEAGFSAVANYGKSYISLGNEDANQRLLVEYSSRSINKNGALAPGFPGYGLPLFFDAAFGSPGFFSWPAIWSHTPQTTNGLGYGYVTDQHNNRLPGELWFMPLGPAADLTNTTFGVQNPTAMMFAGRMLTNGWEFRGRVLNELARPDASVSTNIGLNFETAQAKIIDLIFVGTNNFYSTNALPSWSWTNAGDCVYNYTNFESKEFLIKAGAMDRYLKWPSSWSVPTPTGQGVLPTWLTNQTLLRLTLESWGTGESNKVVTRYGVGTDNTFVFDADASTFFTAASITDPTQKGAVDYLCKALKAANCWTNIVACYPFVGGSATPHSINLKTPGTYNLSYIGAGVSHSANGAAGNATDSYMNTGLNANTVFGSQALSSTHLVLFQRVTAPTDNGYWSSCIVNVNGRVGIGRSGASMNYSIPMTTSGTTTGENMSTDFRGFFAISRENANQWWSVTPTDITVRSTPSSQVPSANYLLGAQNAGSPTFNNAEFAYASIGWGYTSNELRQVRAIVNNFETILGRNNTP